MKPFATLSLLAFAGSTAFARSSRRRQTKTTKTSEQPRIIGGSAVAAGQYPFFVNWEFCGAVLVYPDIILSAAHCNADIVTNQVYIGNTILSNISEGGTSKTIVQRSVHPNYNWRTLENDYLVMKINSNATQRPIPMNANPDYPVTREILTVIGFGTLTNGGKAMSPTLQQVNVTAFSQTSCNTSYPKQIDQNTMLCAGVTGGGRDSCKGDSGGPLFDNNGTLVGLVSWGNQCALAGFPGVYARISGGYSWINHQICDMSSYPPEWCPRKKRVSRRKPTRFPSPATAAPVQPHS